MSGAEGSTRRLAWLRVVMLVAAVEAIATAIWLIPASADIVSWPPSGPERVALFASRGSFVWLIVLGFLLALALAAWSRKAGATAQVAGRAAPFCLLWLWAVPYLPWVPDRIPMLLVLAGPVRWIIAGAAVIAAARLDERLWKVFHDQRHIPGRRTVFALSLAIYVPLGFYSARVVGPGGDEPHYLMIAHSLLTDGDIQIGNNHERGDYRRFYAGELRPDYLRRGLNGEIYSIHAPGLPVLLLPAYAVAGYLGAVAFLCLIAALAALAVFDLAKALAGPTAAFITWLAVCLTVPFVPYSWLVFPEIAGALAVAWAALWLWRPVEHGTSMWIGRGLVLGYLPWLHTKFVVFLAILGAALLLRLRHRPRTALAFAAPVAASLAAWILFFYAIYGEPNPGAPYGNYADQHILLANIPRGMLGLMVDQKFGLLFYSPIYLFAAAGGWIMLRRPSLRYLGAVFLLATAIFIGGASELYMWWGGNSAPARYLVPLLPCLAPMIAVAVGATRAAWARTLLGVWLLISLGIAIIGTGWPSRLLIFSEPHGRARLLELIQAGAPLASSLPTFTVLEWQRSLLDLVPWLAAATLGVMTIVVISRWRRSTPLWLGIAGAMASLLAAGVLTGRAASEVREDTSTRGVLDVMWRYDPGRLRAFDYTRMEKIDPVQLLRASTLVVRQPTGTTDNVRGTAGPFALPPGTYEARVWFTGARSRDGEILVSSSRHAVYGRSAGTLRNPAVVPFELPVGVRRVSIDVGDSTAAALVNRIEVTAASLVPAGARETFPVRAVESIEGRFGAYIVYVDEHVYPEGGVFWTRDTERTTVLVAPGDASRLVLTLHLGPMSGDVAVLVAGREMRAHVNANDTTVVEVDVPRHLRLVPITVQSPAHFRPSEVDAAATDTRRLGCQVRVALK